MTIEEMTPRERWLAVLERREPDRLPMDYWGTAEATEKVIRHLGCADAWEMYDRLHIDRPISVAPHYIGPPVESGYDMYGCHFRDIHYETGVYSECDHHPLAQYDAVEEIESHYTWPSVDWFDYTAIPGQLAGKERYPVRGGGSEPFNRYAKLRGMEQAYMDLLLYPDLVHYCLGKLYDFCYEDTTRIYEQIPGQVTFSYVAEDLGSQEGLLFSPAQIAAFFLPHMRRMIDLAHRSGVYVFHHDDGAIVEILPTLIEIGIDILNPLQWRCKGMERRELKRRFGDRLVLHGGVDNQQTLAFGSVQDVRDEVAYNIDVLGAGGGYILAPCHNVQAVSPPENIVAMYEAGYESGRR